MRLQSVLISALKAKNGLKNNKDNLVPDEA